MHFFFSPPIIYNSEVKKKEKKEVDFSVIIFLHANFVQNILRNEL